MNHDIRRRPVVNVDWEDAVKYCKWAGKRLLTEAGVGKSGSGNGWADLSWGNEAPTRFHANYEERNGTMIKP